LGAFAEDGLERKHDGALGNMGGERPLDRPCGRYVTAQPASRLALPSGLAPA
jgi:hypothetical protein